MANVINYHIHIRTNFTRDGFYTITRDDPQTKTMETVKYRKMTKEEIIKHVLYRREQNRPIWLNENVYRGLI